MANPAQSAIDNLYLLLVHRYEVCTLFINNWVVSSTLLTTYTVVLDLAVAVAAATAIDDASCYLMCLY